MSSGPSPSQSSSQGSPKRVRRGHAEKWAITAARLIALTTASARSAEGGRFAAVRHTPAVEPAHNPAAGPGPSNDANGIPTPAASSKKTCVAAPAVASRVSGRRPRSPVLTHDLLAQVPVEAPHHTANTRTAVEGSLRRLGHRIDLYYQHRIEP